MKSFDYRPLNLSQLERDALKAILETVVAQEDDEENYWLATNRAGIIVLNHIIDKLYGRPKKGNSK